jgi:glutathione S-transferase
LKNINVGSLNVATSLLATLMRSGSGISSDSASVKPTILLKLYDIENCPYCRLVREVLTELDLDAQIYPCPGQGERYRPDVINIGGKAQFPYLVDDNTGVAMYESLDIIRYLFTTYGQRALPLKWQFPTLQTAGSMLASTVRSYFGTSKRSSHLPENMLELYSFESSPYARPVRECLFELEIPYILRSCGRTEFGEWLLPPIRDALNIVPDSELTNRKALQEKAGRMAIPCLVDPNQNMVLFESVKIVVYLQFTYG